jgi:hypothetical protein
MVGVMGHLSNGILSRGQKAANFCGLLYVSMDCQMITFTAICLDLYLQYVQYNCHMLFSYFQLSGAYTVSWYLDLCNVNVNCLDFAASCLLLPCVIGSWILLSALRISLYNCPLFFRS